MALALLSRNGRLRVGSGDIRGIVARSDRYERLLRVLGRKTAGLPVCSDDFGECACSHLCGATKRVLSHSGEPLSQGEFSDLMGCYRLRWKCPDDYFAYLTRVFWQDVQSEYDRVAREGDAIVEAMDELLDADPSAYDSPEYRRLDEESDAKFAELAEIRNGVFEKARALAR